jgi:hypothetical protein
VTGQIFKCRKSIKWWGQNTGENGRKHGISRVFDRGVVRNPKKLLAFRDDAAIGA